MKILITRESAEPLSSMLEEHGLETTHVPCVQLLATGLPAPHGPPPDAVLISSAAVARFLPNLAAVIGNARVVAVEYCECIGGAVRRGGQCWNTGW